MSLYGDIRTEPSMADLRYLARAGLGDTTGTTVMITERVRRVMDIMATEPVAPAVRAVALRELTRMLGVAADGWAGYVIETALHESGGDR